MSDYNNIRNDCAKVAVGMRGIIELLESDYKIMSEEPDDKFYDPDWTLNIDNKEALKIISLLKGTAGLLHHLGNEKIAAAALFSLFIADDQAKA